MLVSIYRTKKAHGWKCRAKLLHSIPPPSSLWGLCGFWFKESWLTSAWMWKCSCELYFPEYLTGLHYERVNKQHMIVSVGVFVGVTKCNEKLDKRDRAINIYIFHNWFLHLDNLSRLIYSTINYLFTHLAVKLLFINKNLWKQWSSAVYYTNPCTVLKQH